MPVGLAVTRRLPGRQLSSLPQGPPKEQGDPPLLFAMMYAPHLSPAPAGPLLTAPLQCSHTHVSDDK